MFNDYSLDDLPEFGYFDMDDPVFKLPEPETSPVGTADSEPITEAPVGTVEVTMSSGLVRKFREDEPTYPPALDVLSAQDKLDAINAELKPMLDREREIDKEIVRLKEEMARAIEVLANERHAIREATFDLRRQQRAAAQAVREAMLILERALEAQRLNEAFIQKSSEFDNLIVNMPWRDKAFPHQIEGAKQIAIAGRAILGDKMGLGKSLTSLISADMLQVQRLLIIVPDDVVSNFVNEAHHWAPHRNVVMLGKLPKVQRAMAMDFLQQLNEYTCVINYSAWRRDTSLLDKLIGLRFQMVILDEAHNVKETTTNAYRGCREVIMADNSCPECYGPILRQKYSEPIVDSEGHKVYAYSSEFYFCKVQNCGWSEVRDMEQGITRDFGSKRSIKHVVPMTGTVILNKPTDLYALLSLIQPEIYDNKREFERTYCEQDYYTGKIKFKSGGLDSLTKKLAGRYIARDRSSAGVVLPKQTIQYHNIEMDAEMYPKQASVIQQLTKHAMLLLEGGKQMPILAMIALITRKRQANVWPAGIEIKDEDGAVVYRVGDDVQESIKLDKIITPTGEDGLVPDITANGNMELGENVVIFSQFKGPLKELERRMTAAGISVARFDGDTPQDIRNAVKIDFDRKYREDPNYTPKWQVVLCNYRTGGVGLNFTAATQMIIIDEEWSPGKAGQAYARMDRMGQTEETTVHVLQLDKSVDTWMRQLNEEKADMIAGFETSAELSGMLYQSMKNGEI